MTLLLIVVSVAVGLWSLRRDRPVRLRDRTRWMEGCWDGDD